MSSSHASEVKIGGHINEYEFADLIGGQVNRGSHADKKDVIDTQDRSHSVKGGTWWQVFLYSRDRLKTNTIFQGLGDVATIMIGCIDAYPGEYKAYLADKYQAKKRLQPRMRELLNELQKPKIFRAFLDKALFDGGNAEYLSIFPGPTKTDMGRKTFHVFHKNDVVDSLSRDVTLKNSKARRSGEMDDQKVVFYSNFHGKNIGEIEDRHDSAGHYREMKFRLNGLLVFGILVNGIELAYQAREQVMTYGKSVRLFK